MRKGLFRNKKAFGALPNAKFHYDCNEFVYPTATHKDRHTAAGVKR